MISAYFFNFLEVETSKIFRFVFPKFNILLELMYHSHISLFNFIKQKYFWNLQGIFLHIFIYWRYFILDRWFLLYCFSKWKMGKFFTKSSEQTIVPFGQLSKNFFISTHFQPSRRIEQIIQEIKSKNLEILKTKNCMLGWDIHTSLL